MRPIVPRTPSFFRLPALRARLRASIARSRARRYWRRSISSWPVRSGHCGWASREASIGEQRVELGRVCGRLVEVTRVLLFSHKRVRTAALARARPRGATRPKQARDQRDGGRGSGRRARERSWSVRLRRPPLRPQRAARLLTDNRQLLRLRTGQPECPAEFVHILHDDEIGPAFDLEVTKPGRHEHRPHASSLPSQGPVLRFHAGTRVLRQ